MEKKKIIIDLSGGTIQKIVTNIPDVEVVIYDWDDIKAGDDSCKNSHMVVDEETLNFIEEDLKKEVVAIQQKISER